MTDYRKTFVEPLYDYTGEQHPELTSPGTFAHYQFGTQATAIYPQEIAMPYLIAGLASEVGEVADKYKKAVRDGHPLDTEGFAKELGDVLWYVARLAAENGLSMESVALGNLEKLRSRMERNKLTGSGDNR